MASSIIPPNEQVLLDQTLLYAAGQGDEPLIVKLLRQGANPKANQSGPLRTAVAKGLVGSAKILMPVSDLSADGQSALLLAAEGGSAECVQLLAASSPAKGIGQALEKAAENGSAACLAVLIGASNSKNKSSRSLALLMAAARGHAECVKLLVSHANPATQSDALTRAAARGHFECVELLIPGSNMKSFGGSALRSAAFAGSAPCVFALMESGSLIPEREKVMALRLAVCRGHAGVAREIAIRLPDESFSAETLRAEALASGHVDVVALFDSLREEEALSLATKAQPSFSSKSRL